MVFIFIFIFFCQVLPNHEVDSEWAVLMWRLFHQKAYSQTTLKHRLQLYKNFNRSISLDFCHLCQVMLSHEVNGKWAVALPVVPDGSKGGIRY